MGVYVYVLSLACMTALLTGGCQERPVFSDLPNPWVILSKLLSISSGLSKPDLKEGLKLCEVT